MNQYLTFNGNARQAMEFYASVFGGTMTLSTFGEFGGAAGSDAEPHHARQPRYRRWLQHHGRRRHQRHEIPAAGRLLVSLSGDDATALRGYWEKLSASGTVTMPLEKQVWGDEFGMCIDGFGIPWMVNISSSTAQPGA
jgi:PhnB protein